MNVWGKSILMGDKVVSKSEAERRVTDEKYPKAEFQNGVVVCTLSLEGVATATLRKKLAASRAIMLMNERDGLQNIPTCNSISGCEFCIQAILGNAGLLKV
jgi:hypothetical protein